MSEKPAIPRPAVAVPGPQYTKDEGLGVALALAQRCMAELRTLARIPGPAGLPGKDGKDGERGQKGEPGRNATDLTALIDHIDERIEQQFLLATMTTPDGGRTMRWSMAGKVHEVKTAVVLDAGVWREGAAYVAGDAVSHGGSLFIAQTATCEVPGKSDDWRLAVKRGRDGKEGKPGERGALGPRGEQGQRGFPV